LRGSRELKNALVSSRLPYKGSLARAYLRTSEHYRSLLASGEIDASADGVPLPPPRLRVLVAGTADPDWFLSSGRAHADSLRELLAGAGRPLERMGAILDFGCGCGRIARWFVDAQDTEIHGCDYNGELAAWCDSNLSFMRVANSGLLPPLPYPDYRFDFVYAFSVFTHLSEDLAYDWMAELRRVVKPGGLIWFTVHGQSYVARLSARERSRFDAGNIVVRLAEIEGTNLCCSYWPEIAIEHVLGSEFEMVAHLDPDGADGSAPALAEHDAYLVRRL
jgi:SAM-dependent methyltransferase